MSPSTYSKFEAALTELAVPVTRVTRAEFQHSVDEIVDQPAVGVALDESLGDPDLSLSETSVEVDCSPATLRAARTGVTSATLGIAEYGSLALSITDQASELVSLFVERHLVVLREADLLDSMKAAVTTLDERLERTGGSTIIATGPSATADMGALVKGAHGPREVHVVVVVEEDEYE